LLICLHTKAIRKVHVNIVDLIDTHRTGEKVKTFRNAGALGQYTKSTGKVFPKRAAKTDVLLKALLREIA
jgi:hypothetical protein